jgi:hypothetical protein
VACRRAVVVDFALVGRLERAPVERELAERPALERELADRAELERELAERPAVDRGLALAALEPVDERPVLLGLEALVLRRPELPLGLEPDPPLLACGICSSLKDEVFEFGCTLLLSGLKMWVRRSGWSSS